jgi:hypothetical protein
MKYRIENVHIPESAGIARPEDPNDQSRDLNGRRIVHVLSVEQNSSGGVRARVLTEEAD